MTSVARSLLLAGALVAFTIPASADEIVKTYSYEINGMPLPFQQVSVEDEGFTQARIREHAVFVSPSVQTNTSVVRTRTCEPPEIVPIGSTCEPITTTTTIQKITRDSALTVPAKVLFEVEQDAIVREFSAVVPMSQNVDAQTFETPAPQSFEASPHQESHYWPLLDYSVFD